MGFRGTPWTRTTGCRAGMGSAPPVRRSPPFGPSIRQPSLRPKSTGGPPCAFAPLQRSSPRIRTANHRSGDLRHRPDERHMLPLMDFDHPTAHASVVVPLRDGRSLRHRVPRRGLATSFATFTTRSCDLGRLSASRACRPAEASRSTHGLHPARGFPRPRSELLSEPYALLPLPRSSSLCPKAPGADARPSSGPSSRGESVPTPELGKQASRAPAADPFLGFHHSRACTHLNRSSL